MPRNYLLVLCAVLSVSTAANGGAILDLVPREAGPFAPGQRVVFDFQLTQEPGGQDRYLRGMGFNLGLTDPALTFDDEFIFDYSSQAICTQTPEACGAGYVDFYRTPPSTGDLMAEAAFTGMNPDPDRQMLLPQTGPITVGAVGVTLPTQPGEYVLSALNSTAQPCAVHGGYVTFGFGLTPDDEPTYQLASGDGVVGGGTFRATTTARSGFLFEFDSSPGQMVPEPATLALLTLGAAVFGRRRAGA